MMAIPPCTASAALQQARNCNGLSATVLSRSSSSMYEELNSMSSEKKQQMCISCTESPSATSGSTSSIRSADVCCCMSHNNANTCSRSSGSGHESTAAAAAAAETSGISLDTNMRAMLRKVMVNEWTLNQAIESCGGGTKGMKELMRRIMFWVQETYVESPEASAIMQGLEKLCMIKTRTAGSMDTPYEKDHRSCCISSYSRAADRLGKGLPAQFHQDLLQYQQYYGWQQQRGDHRAAAPLASTPAAFSSFTFADALDAAAVTNSVFAYTPAAAALHVGSRVVTTTKDAAAAASARAAHATARAACKRRMARQRGQNAGPMQLHPAAQHQATHNAMPGLSPPGPAPVCSPRTGSSWPSVPAMPHGTAAKTRTPPADIPVVVKRQQQVPESTDTLFFLLQKELRPSDVSNLGRIVLPKKEAETHLPWVAMREGLSIGMEDFDTGKMWTFRYRFWPNNKSRMYLLENIGGFVKMHYLQEGDLLILYRNTRGNYVARGKKNLHRTRNQANCTGQAAANNSSATCLLDNPIEEEAAESPRKKGRVMPSGTSSTPDMQSANLRVEKASDVNSEENLSIELNKHVMENSSLANGVKEVFHHLDQPLERLPSLTLTDMSIADILFDIDTEPEATLDPDPKCSNEKQN
ncbi:hypothetical protein CY35_08G029800 [Sphagnum magellanicum]|nr:hypothetical protein CY35_08G029800 [Sphagnum magellanicum]